MRLRDGHVQLPARRASLQVVHRQPRASRQVSVARFACRTFGVIPRSGCRYSVLVKSAIKQKYMITDAAIKVSLCSLAASPLSLTCVVVGQSLPVRKLEDEPKPPKPGEPAKGESSSRLTSHCCSLLLA